MAKNKAFALATPCKEKKENKVNLLDVNATP